MLSQARKTQLFMHGRKICIHFDADFASETGNPGTNYSVSSSVNYATDAEINYDTDIPDTNALGKKCTSEGLSEETQY